ncbi:hypothetical protein POSPLADRAFT_1131094 [Postia placenta MAD-698-R-SB12]|uniref:Uncharacterized protein n=1 Tax=Postia placenta MAD-698-R-SB12 TaxID=670580 RepID=A0A1X6NDE1_9APHY|nr:hypothetical protein POSPLADRAFT_1131094 [Postia placenta MAD-698-R-SB12]OSX66550.1 hypothetical protein POSPLADRAFT_1131094 [Postia placenta MAD-698-R-SB12]
MAYTYYQSTSPRMWGTPQGADWTISVHMLFMMIPLSINPLWAAWQLQWALDIMKQDIGTVAFTVDRSCWLRRSPPILVAQQATHLWHYSGRSLDNLGLRGACETAAATASRIATRIMGVDGYSNAEMSNYGRAPSYDSYNDDYATRPRALRRRSSYSVGLSTVPGASYGMGATGYAPPASPWAGTMSMARSTTPLPVTQGAYVQPGMGGIGVVPGNPGTYMGAPGVLGSAYGAGTTVGTYPGGILPTGVPVPYSANTVSAVYPAGPVGTVYPAAPPTYSAGQYAVNQNRGGVAPAPPGVYGPGYASIMPVPGYNTTYAARAGRTGGRLAGAVALAATPNARRGRLTAQSLAGAFQRPTPRRQKTAVSEFAREASHSEFGRARLACELPSASLADGARPGASLEVGTAAEASTAAQPDIDREDSGCQAPAGPGVPARAVMNAMGWRQFRAFWPEWAPAEARCARQRLRTLTSFLEYCLAWKSAHPLRAKPSTTLYYDSFVMLPG